MGYKGNQAGVAGRPVPSSASAYGSYTGNGFHNGTHQDPSFDSLSSSNSQFGDGYYAQFGAPVIGEPANPSVHPDNQQAATLTYTGSSQASFMKKAPAQPTTGYYYGQQQQQQPSTSYSSAAVQQPPNTSSSPYVQTSALPGGPGTGVMGYLNKLGKKAEVLSATIWTHLKVGNSVTDSAWGRLSHGTRLLTEGGFKGVYKQTFSGFAPNEQLRKTYACYLSTSNGPVGGTLYITNKKFAFCSDRPLPYAPISGQQAWSYYKVVLPLEKVREVLPAHNQNKPSEKYIQVVTIDGHEFWFMGLVNYDKGLKNMQEAVAVTRRGQPVSPAAAQASGVKQQNQNASYPPINQGDSSSTARNNAAPQQGESRYGNQYAWK